MTAVLRRATAAGLAFVTIAALAAGAHASGQAAPQVASPAAPALPLVRAVRVALGHGNVDEARRVLQATRETGAARAVAGALIAIHDGKDDEARRALAPLVTGDTPNDDALLELGRLELRRGRKEAATELLGKVGQASQDLDTDGFLRMALAATATGDVNAANSVFQRIGASDTDRADVQAAWGDLFLATHANAEAARSYQDALKADPNWVPALLGLVRALQDDDTVAADQAMTKAQQLAPKAPDVWLLTAERQLAVQDFAGARASLDKVAAARTGSLEELALRASAVYATGSAADVEPLVAQAKAINPSSVAVLRAVSGQAGQLYRFDDAVAFARRAVAADDTVAGPHADLGQFLLRTGDEAAARTELETAFKIDPYDTVVFNLLQMLDTLDKYTTVEASPFIFKFPADQAAVLKTYALPLAQAAYDEYKARYAFTPAGPILIEIFDTHDSFAVRTAGLPGIVGALGACFGRVIAMDSPKARPPGDFSWHATLWHEIAHVFTLQASNYKVPRWLTEGLSQYEEHRRSAPWGRELTMQYARLMAQGETFTLKKLTESFKTHRIAMGYFEASLLAEHLEALGGTAALRTLLAAYKEGADDTAAFTKAFGKTVPEIEASFRAFATDRFGALATALKDPARTVADDDSAALKARAEAEPGNYISQMAWATDQLKSQQAAGAKAALTRAAALAPAAGGDDGPFAMLATIAVQDGNKAEARRHLRHLLEHDHDNIAAARTLASLADEAGAEGQADAAFAYTRIADLDPFDGEAHTGLGRRELAAGRVDRAIQEFEAALALNPPNLADANTDLGEAYLKAGRKDDAKRRAFAALELAPTFARAQDLLLAALGKSEAAR